MPKPLLLGYSDPLGIVIPNNHSKLGAVESVEWPFCVAAASLAKEHTLKGFLKGLFKAVYMGSIRELRNIP